MTKANIKLRAQKRNRLRKLYRIIMDRLEGVSKIAFQRLYADNPHIHNH